MDEFDDFTAYLLGRLYGYERPDARSAPCDAWLRERYRLEGAKCEPFVLGFILTRFLGPFSDPVDPNRRECRCANGCQQGREGK